MEAANSTFEDAIKRFKDHPEIYNYYGEICLDKANYEEALESFDKSISLDSTNPLPHINKAILFLQSRQDVAGAESECRKVRYLNNV